MLLILVTSGCVTSSKDLAKIGPGMSKQEVVQILGTPASVSSHERHELLRYQLSGRMAPILNPNGYQFAEGYTVQLKNGKVIAYGRDDEFQTIHVRSQE